MSTSSGPYAALDWRFKVNCTVSTINTELERVLAPLRVTGAALATYSIQPVPGRQEIELTCDAQPLCRSRDEALIFRRLLGHINVGAVQASSQYVLLHAAAVEHHGRAVVLPAPMESGKTTLAAGLLRSGLRYLTDETVALRPSDGHLVAYPKALSIDQGSYQVLYDMRPRPAPGAQHLVAAQWQVPATALRADAVCMTARPAVVILPGYVAGGDTVLREISPGAAMINVLQQVFELGRNRERDMRAIGQMIDACDTYHLQVGNLDEAVRLVRSTLGA